MRQLRRETVSMNTLAPQTNEDDDIDPEEIQSASDETPTDVDTTGTQQANQGTYRVG